MMMSGKCMHGPEKISYSTVENINLNIPHDYTTQAKCDWACDEIFKGVAYAHFIQSERIEIFSEFNFPAFSTNFDFSTLDSLGNAFSN